MANETLPERTTTDDKPLSLRVPKNTQDRVKAAAEATGLKAADIYRLAIERGVDVVVSQLTTNGGAE